MIRFRRPRSATTLARRVLAGLLAVAAVVAGVRQYAVPRAPGAAPPTTAVAVAAVDLRPGRVLQHGDLRSAAFPAGLVPSGTVPDPAVLDGRVVASGVRAGEPITDVRLVGRGLTALLPAGLVAAPVRPADLAVADLVQAGDRVDVLASGPDTPRAQPVATAALVLAVPRPAATDADRGGSGTSSGGLLLLAVDGDTAARLAAASATATLSVALAPP